LLKMLKKAFQHFSLNNTGFILVLLGTITWSLTMVKSGLVYDYGMGFWGPNGHDGVWHVAVVENLARGSFNMPVFAGEMLGNYHVGFDLIVAFVHRITTIPIVNLYFQIIPLILAFLIGLLTYKFVYLWRRSRKEAFWATFFVYFGGSWGWLVSLVSGGGLGGESLFWAQQSISTLINPPFALSLVLILYGLLLLMRKQTRATLIGSTLIFGSLIQVKAYAGVLVLGGLLVVGLYNFWRRKGSALLKVFLFSTLLSLVLFFPANWGSPSLLVWEAYLEDNALASRASWEASILSLQ